MNRIQQNISCKIICLIGIIGIFPTYSVFSQDQRIDSLQESFSNMVETDEGYLSTMHLIADHYAYAGKDAAREYIDGLEAYSNKFNSPDAQNYYYSDMATLMFRQNKTDSAQHYWKLELQNSLNDSFQIARIYTEMSSVHLQALRYDSLEYYSKLALGIAKRHNPENKKFHANCYNSMGIANDIKEDYTQAINYYIKAAEIKEQIGAKRSAASTYVNLATLYGRIENHEQAKYSRQSIQHF